METKEYYTPTIEELFIGYECEYATDDDFSGDDVRIGKLLGGDLVSIIELQCSVRTPSLSKQDIIDLGFVITYYKHPFLGDSVDAFYKDYKTEGFNELNQIRVVKHPKSQIIEIHKIVETSWGSSYEQLFSGLCKSKNELKKLMKDYLNIPI